MTPKADCDDFEIKCDSGETVPAASVTSTLNTSQSIAAPAFRRGSCRRHTTHARFVLRSSRSDQRIRPAPALGRRSN
jgi:hypothetical protein